MSASAPRKRRGRPAPSAGVARWLRPVGQARPGSLGRPCRDRRRRGLRPCVWSRGRWLPLQRGAAPVGPCSARQHNRHNMEHKATPTAIVVGSMGSVRSKSGADPSWPSAARCSVGERSSPSPRRLLGAGPGWAAPVGRPLLRKCVGEGQGNDEDTLANERRDPASSGPSLACRRSCALGGA